MRIPGYPLRHWVWLLFTLWLLAPAGHAAEPTATNLPTGGGLPVVVRTGLRFGHITAVDEKESTFTATIDLRLRWKDTRLAYPPSDSAAYRSYKDATAKAQLATMWAPSVELANAITTPALRVESVRIFPDGQVEWMQRLNAKFSPSFDPERFPFDQQKLAVELIVRGDDQNRVVLDYQQDDLEFSGELFDLTLNRWDIGLVNIRREPLDGIYGAIHSRLWVELQIQRKLTMALAPMFIPLFASLLIPLMAVFMNRVTDGVFQIEAFSLSNIVIGGLFAVIALNFTVNNSYPTLAASDNAVTRLFGLSYCAQGAALAIIVIMFRFNMIREAFGKYVQEQLFLCIIWAGPVLALATAVSLLLVAMA